MIITKASLNARKSLETVEINAIIKHLSEKALDEINIPNSAVGRIKDKMEKTQQSCD